MISFSSLTKNRASVHELNKDKQDRDPIEEWKSIIFGDREFDADFET